MRTRMFALHVIRGEAVAQIVVIGEVRRREATLLSDCIAALAARGVTRVVVDLDRTGFMNVVACDTLLRAAGRLDAGGAKLFVTGVRGRVRLLLFPRVVCRPHATVSRRSRTPRPVLLRARR